jgi:hypothetical protein
MLGSGTTTGTTPTPEIALTDILTPPTFVFPTSGGPVSDAFDEIDRQLQSRLKASIAFNKPTNMERDQTTAIELILNPSMSETALATQLAERAGSPDSGLSAETAQIEITPRMKTILRSQDPDAFAIIEMHENAEQPISLVETTAWRWSVTARKEGLQILNLTVYRLVKYDGKEFWREVQTYQANIAVEVSISNWMKSLDWKWLASTLLIPLALAAWGWWNHRKKRRSKGEKPARTPRKSGGDTIHVHVGGDVHGDLVVGDENEIDKPPQ